MDLLHRQYMAKCHLHFAGCALEIQSSLGFIFPLLLLVLNFYQSVALIVIIIVDCSITGWLIIWVWPTLTLSWRMPLSYRNQFIDSRRVKYMIMEAGAQRIVLLFHVAAVGEQVYTYHYYWKLIPLWACFGYWLGINVWSHLWVTI